MPKLEHARTIEEMESMLLSGDLGTIDEIIDRERIDAPQTKKTFILDTNIMIREPEAFLEFTRKTSSKVVLLDTVLGEFDKLKERQGQVGKHARESIAFLDHRTRRRRDRLGDLYANGLRVYTHDNGKNKKHGLIQFVPGRDGAKLDYRPDLGEQDLEIIAAAKKYMEEHDDESVVLISNDRAVRVTARINGVPAEPRKYEDFDPAKIYTGFEIINDPEIQSELYGIREQSKLGLLISEIDRAWAKDPIANKYFVFLDPDRIMLQHASRFEGGRCVDDSCIWRYDVMEDALVPVNHGHKKTVLGLKPQNLGQQLAFDLASLDHVRTISLMGSAGSGKTLMALLHGMQNVHHARSKKHNNEATVIVAKRAIATAGEEYGWLPGDINDKTVSNYAGVRDNYELIMARKHAISDSAAYPDKFEQAIRDESNSLIEMSPIGFIKGSSFDDDDELIIDEGQDTEIDTLEEIATRMGDGRLWVLGDPRQTDNPRTRPDYNGMTQLINMIQSMTDAEYAHSLGHITLKDVRRGHNARMFVQHYRHAGKPRRGAYDRRENEK